MFAACDLRTPLGKRDLALYLLMLRTGMHVREAVGLRTADFDRRAGRLGIRFEGSAGDVFVPDAPRLRDALDRWEDVRRWWDPEGSSPFYFITAQRSPLRDADVRRALARRARRAGIARRVTPEMLRHSFAVELLRDGYTPHEIRDALRQPDLAATRAYLRLLSGGKQRLARTAFFL